MNDKTVSIRPARRDDVPAIVAMLADDHLGRFAAIRRWIGEAEAYLGLASAR